MSSVQRFIRQIAHDNTYYSAAAVVASPSTLAFSFIPSSGNVVGNYPPGYVATNVTALTSAINAAANASGVVLRDMGKTIQAPVGSLTGAVSFFRQVQLISVASSVTFGVLGGSSVPDANTDYLTFYIPIMIGGVAAAVAALPVHSACQM